MPCQESVSFTGSRPNAGFFYCIPRDLVILPCPVCPYLRAYFSPLLSFPVQEVLGNWPRLSVIDRYLWGQIAIGICKLRAAWSLWDTFKVASFQPRPPTTSAAACGQEPVAQYCALQQHEGPWRQADRFAGDSVEASDERFVSIGLTNRGKSASSEILHGEVGWLCCPRCTKAVLNSSLQRCWLPPPSLLLCSSEHPWRWKELGALQDLYSHPGLPADNGEWLLGHGVSREQPRHCHDNQGGGAGQGERL